MVSERRGGRGRRPRGIVPDDQGGHFRKGNLSSGRNVNEMLRVHGECFVLLVQTSFGG